MVEHWENSWETVSRIHKNIDDSDLHKEPNTIDGISNSLAKKHTSGPLGSSGLNSEINTSNLRRNKSSSPLLNGGFKAALDPEEEKALKKLPGLLNDYILSKCESNEHCRKSDFDGVAREALLRINFLQALQAVENFASSVSSRIHKRPAYLMCILRGKEQHWDKSRASAGLEGGTSELLSLPPTVLVTLADLCIGGNCVPSDFTPEVCLSLHRLSAPLAILAVHAFNTNKRIVAGNRGGVLNRPRFFQRLIHNVAEQNSNENVKLDCVANNGNSGNIGGHLIPNLASTPTSESSNSLSTSSSIPSSPTQRNNSPGGDQPTVSKLNKKKNVLRKSALLKSKESSTHVSEEDAVDSSNSENLRSDTVQNMWNPNLPLNEHDRNASGKIVNDDNMKEGKLDCDEPHSDSSTFPELNHATDSFLTNKIVGDLSANVSCDASIDYYQQYQQHLMLQRPHLRAWNNDSREHLGCPIEKNFPQLTIDVNASRSQQSGYEDGWQQQQQAHVFNGSALVNDLIGDETPLSLQLQPPSTNGIDKTGHMAWQRSQSTTIPCKSNEDDWSDAANMINRGIGGLADVPFLSSISPTASRLSTQELELPSVGRLREDMLFKEIRVLNNKLEQHINNGRALGEVVTGLRQALYQLHEENERIANEHQTLLAGLRLVMDQNKQKEGAISIQ